MAYQKRTRRNNRRRVARQQGKLRDHPRVGTQSRTMRRAGTKTKVIPKWHPMYGSKGHKPPKYRYPGFSPGRLEDARR